MIEIVGDLWAYHAQGEWIAITTNGSVRRDGCAVMGRGCAREAAQRYPLLPRFLGSRLATGRNQLYAWDEYRMLTFPVKHWWYERADTSLIARSACELRAWLETHLEIPRVIVPRPGCRNGMRRWKDVAVLVAGLWDDRVWVISPPTAGSNGPRGGSGG